jgi:lipoyl-dependent peroxiredoxin
MALEKILYTAHAVSTGGRDGSSKTDDGKLQVKLAPPKEMGGNGDGTPSSCSRRVIRPVSSVR